MTLQGSEKHQDAAKTKPKHLKILSTKNVRQNMAIFLMILRDT